MGVVITGYKNVSLVEDPKWSDDGDYLGDKPAVTIYIGQRWSQADNLIENQTYEYEQSFDALNIPYGCYGDLRNDLAKLAGYNALENTKRPYAEGAWRTFDLQDNNQTQDPNVLLKELINFPDNEGEIGNQTCRLILKDLQKIAPSTIALNSQHKDWFDQLLECFEFVKENGFIQYR